MSQEIPPQPVLIVEDDPDSRLMLDMLLTRSGYRTVSASNGLEGLEAARRDRPCLILLDLMMPVMDGTQFRAQQLQDPSLRSIPVILVTASHDAQLQARKLKAVSCVPKPINPEDVIARVGANCGRS